jgi:uncharacterized protein with HEPN domain
MKDQRVYLHHILDAAGRIEEYGSPGRDVFFSSNLHQDAAIRQLAIIGEAASKLGEHVRDRHSEVPWAKIISFRNILIHDYVGVKLEILWDIIRDDLPTLKQQVQQILEELNRGH